ncbi:hypothetical protein CW713_02675 [Methanophagales archaeon]|nr:MAG: hypothetical protein CW713_02675 [Methanophagales archaeon]
MLFETVITGILVNVLNPKTIREIWERLKKREKRSEIEIRDIRKFWKISREEELREGMYVTIKGTLSKYAPMTIGDPKVKREEHRKYRRTLLELEKESKKPESITRTVDPMLSFTSGNTIWRIKPLGNLVHLGLYQGIVRNSIPVFIEEKYYEKVEGIFFKGDNPYCVDVVLTGKLGEIPHDYLEKIKISQEGGAPIYGIFIGDESTKIEYIDEASYLDGDIWVALKYKGEEHMLSRYLDLSDVEDFKEERKALEDDVNKYLPESQLIQQFDQINRLVSGKQVVEPEYCWKSFLKLK